MPQGGQKRSRQRLLLTKARTEVLHVIASGAGVPDKTLGAAYARLDRIGDAHDGDRDAQLIDDASSAQLRALTEQLEDDLADEDKPLSREDLDARLEGLYGRFGAPLVAAALSKDFADFLAEFEAAKASIAADAAARAAWLAARGKDPAVAEKREKSRAYHAALRSGDYKQPAQDFESTIMSLRADLKKKKALNAKAKKEGRDWAREAHSARGLDPDAPLPYAVVRHTEGFAVHHATLRGLENMISWDLNKVAAYAEACAATNDISRRAKSTDDTYCLLPTNPQSRRQGWKVAFPSGKKWKSAKMLYLRDADGKAEVFATKDLARTARDAYFRADPEVKKFMVKKEPDYA